jgi:hypothetical protein
VHARPAAKEKTLRMTTEKWRASIREVSSEHRAPFVP